jgi:BirA family transcriptional regulator, biotin operon repressor / biotin---[acetyl-CoA-carboxylase] ligase
MERIDISNPFPGAAAFFVETTASTQEEAKRLAASCYPPGSLVAADAQSAGRGRFPERGWDSEPGKNLLVTIYLGPPRRATPIRVGLALCEAVSDYASGIGAAFASPPRLKWPNDLMLGDRKAAGILCESSAFGGASGGALRAFAGIGLNCNQLAFPPSLGGRATSLALELGREVDRWAILELLLERLAAGFGPELGAGPAAGPEADASGEWRPAAIGRLWRQGRLVSFLPALAARTEGTPPLLGTLEGIDEEGSVLIRIEGEKEARAFPAGELTAAPPADKVFP